MELKDVIKDLNKKFSITTPDGKVVSVVNFGVDESKDATKFSLGTPGFDFCTYNSIPEGIFIEFSGQESSGKTTGAFLLAHNYIIKEKQKPINSRRHILFVDCEGTASPEWAKVSTGYDMNDQDIQTIYLSPLGQSAEQIFDMITEFIKTGRIGLIIFDSLTMIAGQQVNDESLEKKDMGTVPKAIGDFIRRVSGIMRRFRTTFIGINGDIQNISGYGNPWTTGGGTHWKRACSLRIKFKRGDYFDDDGNELKATAENPSGHIIEIAVLKTKFCRWDRKLGRCHLHYVKGIDILQDTIEVATRFDLIEKTGGWYSFKDPNTNQYLLDASGKQIKLNGMSNVKNYFKEHLDFWKLIYDTTYEKLSQKEALNVVSFEQMLNVNIEETFNVDLSKEE